MKAEITISFRHVHAFMLYLLIWSILLLQTVAFVDEDGLCTLFTFSPFTLGGEAATTFSGNDSINPGFSHMAAALMAIEHFNNRSTSVVPELESWRDCSIRFDTSKFRAFDTGSTGPMAGRSFFQEGRTPCAIAGPANDVSGMDLSSFASAAEFPIVPYRSFDARLSEGLFYPFTTNVFPGLADYGRILTQYLMYTGRTDFIAFVYALTDVGAQRRELLSCHFDELGVRWRTDAFVPHQTLENAERGSRSVWAALRNVKDSGYRTIIVSMEDPIAEMPLLANAAEELGLNNGDYCWIWLAKFDPIHVFSEDKLVRKLVAGSAYPIPVASDWLDGTSSFSVSWANLDAAFTERVNAANPITKGQPGYVFAGPSFFSDNQAEYGSGFIYDAVMSIGIGACVAEMMSAENETQASGSAHLAGIRKSQFSGATGLLRFGSLFGQRGTRTEATVPWGSLNLLPLNRESVPYVLSHILLPGGDSQWQTVKPFVYANGLSQPPDLLRDMPEQNYLNPRLRATGLSLMGFAMFMAISSIFWVYANREKRVLLAAQPIFLYVLSFGALVSASSILTLSFDESYGWSAKALSRACVAGPWLLVLGHVIMYGSLFAKHWRVNKVLQFSRRRIDARHVAWPLPVLVFLALVVLSLWTALDSPEWTRREIDEESGESIAQCESNSVTAFAIPLIVLMMIPIVMTGFMAYKTKDVDDAYSESKWIFSLILVQLEVVIVSVPLTVILHDISANGRYISLVLTVLTLTMSTLLLTIGPKVAAHYRKGDNNGPKRGASMGLRVSGVNPPSQYSGHILVRPPSSDLSDANDESSPDQQRVTGHLQNFSARGNS